MTGLALRVAVCPTGVFMVRRLTFIVRVTVKSLLLFTSSLGHTQQNA